MAPWIEDLRVRIERGELKHLSPVNLDTARIDAELVARIMLADLDAFEDLPAEEYDLPDKLVHRRSVLWDLLWLRERIG
jgi:hypothetical protein